MSALRWLAPAIGLGCTMTMATPADARSGGMPSGGCSGCHGDGDHDIVVTSSPQTINPGQTATVTVRVTSPGGAVLGMFIDPSVGTVSAIGGQGLSPINGGLTHSSPKSMSGGVAEFSFQFTAPSQPGAVRFEISAMVGNGNGNSGGDAADDGDFDFVFGCPPQQFFRDHDGDGFGRDSDPLIACQGSPPDTYVPAGGDCDDNNDGIYPGAQEFCNQRDDDCDDIVDEEALPLTLYPDADGDGYYGIDEFQTGETMQGCIPTAGYAGDSGDCQPSNPQVNPGMEEQCNLVDDNCDGRVDERVRPQCGEGWCRREATTCDELTCTPGEPIVEVCNLFDDDCDGNIDNGEVCPAGEACVTGTCVIDDGPDSPTGDDGSAETGGGQDGGGGCSVGGNTAGAWAMLLCGLLTARRRRRR